MTTAPLLWQPDLSARRKPLLSGFMAQASAAAGTALDSFAALHAWSVAQPQDFWPLAWDFCGLEGDQGTVPLLAHQDPMQVRFFPEARLNIVETFLKNADGREAIVFIGEDGRRMAWTRAELKREVEMLAAALRDAGIGAGDHVAGYVPNMPQTVAAMLATASLGAVWSSCAPESGPDVVVDRFGQIEPKLMFAADGYFYNGKVFETRAAIAEVAARVPSVRQIVVWPYAGEAQDLPKGMAAYEGFKQEDAPALDCRPMGFRDPLYVMFSSGTTGKPKCIEHSGGGTLLRMLVEQQLHCDLQPGDRMFYYTTCNWMMWNWQVAALASEAVIVLFDGNPMYPGMRRLFDLAEAEKVTHFGISAKYIDASQKRRNRPADSHDLAALRVVLSTGSPLSPEGFAHVYADWKADVQLASICGGTDILGCFIGGCPLLPVHQGEIQAPMLGLDVATLNDQGEPVEGVAGELVCRNAHPSMPTRFLNDPGNARYRASYFEAYPNIWRQGDFTIRTEHGGYVVLGRSDATLNPGGVRIGTAEIYRQLDKIDEVADAVVVGQSIDNDVRVVLFVVPAESAALDDALTARIKTEIRRNASPRHVPAKIIAVADIPRTKSGKTAELAVRDVVNKHPVRNLSGLANPQVLELFADHPELQA
ncbi:MULTISPECIES: acetoacetate--CoA ligase [unclassified Leisingera]|uniref:acetoacetate--CoA ligase n=1 Tax=unclassified Leisingera TaxID=2614906 RepID=UPI0002FEBA8E|nr:MULTISPECIES: acetoacetate--CoA ligase [unclassified Leisingera]KIC26845.1 acetoacetyl-CoA synthetase [Leisingera sp. ANG-S3]KIC49472.1 acetoacetyl-CoA synthetase [Leisingera sp. ANG-S]KID07088.1 acetoacetyl-CoA synthetase [Leisingera sp. ANG1]